MVPKSNEMLKGKKEKEKEEQEEEGEEEGRERITMRDIFLFMSFCCGEWGKVPMMSLLQGYMPIYRNKQVKQTKTGKLAFRG